jgi:haloacetate dehalogenase
VGRHQVAAARQVRLNEALFAEPLQRSAGLAFRHTANGKPPLLLLHGHPQTHAIWHRAWPSLVEHFDTVAMDLRGYGDSDKPPGEPDHANYSKRAMALDALALMHSLGHERFAVLAHDRGARVAHRLMLDHPQAVTRAVLLDIAPTLAMYEQTAEAFARAYWHWFFLIQPAPLPETLMGPQAAQYARTLLAGRTGSLAKFDPRALAEYERCCALPGAFHAMCEDYRAAAGIDLDHDRASRAAGQRITQPLRVLWGVDGIIERCFEPLALWRAAAEQVDGCALPCGHYIPEEAPEALLDHALPFLLEPS